MLALERFHDAKSEKSLELVEQALSFYDDNRHRDAGMLYAHDPKVAATNYMHYRKAVSHRNGRRSKPCGPVLSAKTSELLRSAKACQPEASQCQDTRLAAHRWRGESFAISPIDSNPADLASASSS